MIFEKYCAKVYILALYSRSRDLVGRNILSNSLYSSLYSSLYYRPRDFMIVKIYILVYIPDQEIFMIVKNYILGLDSEGRYCAKVEQRTKVQRRQKSSRKSQMAFKFSMYRNFHQVFYVSKFS